MNDEERLEWDRMMFLLGNPPDLWSWGRPLVLMFFVLPAALWMLTPPVCWTVYADYEWVGLAVLASAAWVAVATLILHLELTIPTTTVPVLPPLYIGVILLWMVTIMQLASTLLAWLAVCGLFATQFILAIETLRIGGIIE
jgi:hypothetical protein